MPIKLAISNSVDALPFIPAPEHIQKPVGGKRLPDVRGWPRGVAYNLDIEKDKMHRPPRHCGYQIEYPYMVMPMDLQENPRPQFVKRLERAKMREVRNLRHSNNEAKA